MKLIVNTDCKSAPSGSIDYFDVGVATAFKVNATTMLTQSFFTGDKGGFKLEGLETATIDFLVSKTGNKLTSKFNSTIGNSLSNFSPSIGGFLRNFGLTGIKTTVKSVNKYSKDKQKEKKSSSKGGKSNGGTLSPRDF